MSKSKKLLNGEQFGALCGVNRESVYRAYKRKDLYAEKIKKGKKFFLMYDPDHPLNSAYLKSENENRLGKSKGKGKPIKVPERNGKPGRKKKQKESDQEPVKMEVVPIEENSPTLPEEKIEELQEFQFRYIKARTLKLEEQQQKEQLMNAKLRGQLLERQAVYDSVFLYLDKLHANLERLSSSFLSDVGNKILDAGIVPPDVREEWADRVRFVIDDTKNTVVKRLEAIEEGGQ